jgi:DNA-binding response OmpR family regulator
VVGPGAAHLLVIEDEPAVARLTELVLTDAGYSVDLLADHGAASNLLNERRFDLILCDTDLGARTAGLSGLVPLVNAARPSPVLLFSAHRFSAGEIAAAGLAGVIRKPYDIDDLLRVVESNLATSGTADANGDRPLRV